jgi:hypothetical protein
MWKRLFDWFNQNTLMENKMKDAETTMKFVSDGIGTGHFASGDILLGYGQHEIKIVTNGKPCKVTLSIEDPTGGIAVCHGNVNKIGVNILNNGFVLYADIQSNTALVKWNCEF